MKPSLLASVAGILGLSLSACSQLPSAAAPVVEEPAAPIAAEDAAPPQFVEMTWVDEGNTLRAPSVDRPQPLKAPVANAHKGSLSAQPTPPKK